jgi:SAM-dependent methyltransferase
MVSIFYTHPQLYNLLLSFVHKSDLDKRYRIVSRLIGRNKRVFEPGCGTCLITNYLDKSCIYSGWDLNPSFVSYDQKKGLNVKVKNILDFKSYPKSDVILIVDVLHHIVPLHEKLIDAAIDKAKLVIVIEPFNKISLFEKLLPKQVFTFFYQIFSDSDGINSPSKILSEWKLDKQGLKEFFLKKGAKRVINLGDDIIAVIKK